MPPPTRIRAEDLKRLAEAGIDMGDVTKTLLSRASRSSSSPSTKLIGGIELTREGVVTGRPKTIKAAIPDELEPPMIERVQKAAERGGREARLGARRVALGRAGRGGDRQPARLADDQREDARARAASCTSSPSRAKADGLEHAVLLGMGGSSLGPEVIRRSFGDVPGGMRLHVLDSTDPGALLATERAVELDKTLFIVSSKSGGTIETLSHMRHFYERTGGNGSQFCAVTDPGSPLVELARERGFRHVFEDDPDIGGRYSVLSYFGLVPAALRGRQHRGAAPPGARWRSRTARSSTPRESNSGLWLGCVMGELRPARAATSSPSWCPTRSSSFGLWVEQLIAESTGKQGKGILPVAGEPLGDPDVYGDDRVFAYLRNEDEPDEELDARSRRSAAPGHPTTTGRIIGGASDLGRIFFFAEFATAVAGWALGINPFDQPNVQEAKDNTARILEGGRAARARTPGSLDELLRGRGAAEVHRDPRLRDAVRGVRRRGGRPARGAAGAHEVRDDVRLRAALPPLDRASTTRAARRTACSSSSTTPATEDVEIPEAGYTFEHLKNAQALGDMQTLRSHGLPVARVEVDGAGRASGG